MVDVSYWFSGHKAKGQSQTAGLCENVVNSNFLDSFDGKLTNLVQ